MMKHIIEHKAVASWWDFQLYQEYLWWAFCPAMWIWLNDNSSEYDESYNRTERNFKMVRFPIVSGILVMSVLPSYEKMIKWYFKWIGWII